VAGEPVDGSAASVEGHLAGALPRPRQTPHPGCAAPGLIGEGATPVVANSFTS
jgi:hypothetical protein